MISLRIKSIARAFLAASMLATVACESATSPIARAADDNASFGKTSSLQPTTIVMAVTTNASVGQPVVVTATIYQPNHPVGGKKLTMSVDGGPGTSLSSSKLGTAQWTVNGLAAGTHTFVVTFAGDNSYSGSSASISTTVSP